MQVLQFKSKEAKPNMGLRGNYSPEALERLFPFKRVQCKTCGAYYCAREVYFITHAPPYEFSCACGPDGLYLRWKKEKHQDPGRIKEKFSRRLARGLRKFFRGE